MVGDGTPQGGVCSPLIWNLDIDELLLMWNSDVRDRNGVFADDCGTYIKGWSSEYLKMRAEYLQSPKQLIWTRRCGLYMNPKKTELILFHKPDNWGPEIRMEGKVLPFSPWVRFLGVRIDKYLTFEEHVLNQIKIGKIWLAKMKSLLGAS